MLLEPLVCQEALPALALEVLLVPHVVLVVLSLLAGVEFDWLFTAIAHVFFLYFSLTYLFVPLLMPDPLLSMVERLLAVFEAAYECAFN